MHCRADGATFPAEVSLNRLELGADVVLQAVVRDITQRKAMEDALREREAEVSLILNNVSDVIFAVEVTPTVFPVRVRQPALPAGHRAAGAPGRGRAGPGRHPESVHELVFSGYREAIRTAKPVQWEEVSTIPRGSKWVTSRSSPCSTRSGRLHAAGRDGPRRDGATTGGGTGSELNEDLRRHADALEERVRARTAQLAARNQELKDFAYTVSHDLKAPLRGIAGYANELTRKHRHGLSERARFCLRRSWRPRRAWIG